jgi:hypothetical protein
MRWSLLVAEYGYFVTSDNPLVRIVEPRARYRMYADHGFLNKTAEVSFPLSPKVLLILSWDETALERGVLGRKHVMALNQIRAAYCERFGPKKFGAVTVVRRSRSEQSTHA